MWSNILAAGALFAQMCVAVPAITDMASREAVSRDIPTLPGVVKATIIPLNSTNFKGLILPDLEQGPKALGPNGLVDLKHTRRGEIAKRDTIYTIYFTGIVGGSQGEGTQFQDYFDQSDTGHNPDWSKGFAGFAKTVKVWYKDDSSGIYGLQVQYQDNNWGPVHGSQNGDSKQMSLGIGEKITTVNIWPSSGNARIGRLKLVTDRGQTFEVGRTSNDVGYYSPDLSAHSGLLLGFAGRQGNAVNALGLVFLAKIKSHQISNVKFDNNLYGTTQGITNATLKQAVIENNSANSKLNWSFQDSKSLSSSQTMTQMSGYTLGVSLSVTVNLPFVTLGATTSWQAQYSSTSSTSNSETDTTTWSVSGTLDPRTGIRCTAFAGRGELNAVTYTSTVDISVDGWTWEFTDKGTYSGVSYTSAYVSCGDTYPLK